MKIFRKIFSNLPAKILSLIMAILIWVYVGAGLAQVDTFPGKIPIEFKNIPQGLAITTDVNEVTIRIGADSEVWKNLNAGSFSASLDLGNYSEGTYILPVKVETTLNNVQIVEINPAKVTVKLEKIATKEVPLVLQAEGKAADGFVMGNWKLEPNRVKVSGPASVIAKMTEAFVKITLSNERENFERLLPVVALDSSGNQIKNVTFSPGEVKATVPIVPASAAKSVGIKVLTSGQLRPGYWLSALVSDPAQVAVTAGPEQINNLNFINTRPINISGLNKDTELTTTLDPPAGVTVLDNVPLVKVKISVLPISQHSPTPVPSNIR